MRITTQMLNETAKRTGIPVNQTSLLHYINSDQNSSGGTLLDALNQNQKVSSASSADYKKLQKSADTLKQQAEKLADTGEDSFYEKIKAGGSPEELYQAVESYVSSYNTTLSALQKSESTLNQYYGSMLKETADENRESLEKIGISIGKDGALSIDKKKLEAASIDDVQKVFASGELSSKTAFLAGRVTDNAQAGMAGISGQYDLSGNLQAQLASKIDFWG